MRHALILRLLGAALLLGAAACTHPHLTAPAPSTPHPPLWRGPWAEAGGQTEGAEDAAARKEQGKPKEASLSPAGVPDTPPT